MNIELWIAVVGLLGFAICCGIFCLWFNYNERCVQRICERKNREYEKKLKSVSPRLMDKFSETYSKLAK